MIDHAKSLLADDDRDLVDMLRYIFQRDRYNVTVALDGDAALPSFVSQTLWSLGFVGAES